MSVVPCYRYLTEAEVRFLNAAVERLIPSDESGAGAKEANVAYFIDQQLAGSWGVHGRCYRQGPWREGKPQQGYQSRLTPQEIYREAIREIDQHCTGRHGKVFAHLGADLQDEIIRELEAGTFEFQSIPSSLFFELLIRNTQEGFFSDPMYGGNKDKVGWRLIGFPGVPASNYDDHIDERNIPYRVEPVSILDIKNGSVELDSQGYPKHVLLKS
ncbi:MAG: gluconate 2-dehydrogenase subunit 3 family protein [Burkholderiales bacterium]|nr:gluconate 2-dehydrogenase subunit 3 family protein [Burkholderiales bacterium]